MTKLSDEAVEGKPLATQSDRVGFKTELLLKFAKTLEQLKDVETDKYNSIKNRDFLDRLSSALEEIARIHPEMQDEAVRKKKKLN